MNDPNTEPSTMPLMDFFNEVYVPIRLVGRSPRTVELYKMSIRLFERILDRVSTLADLNDLTVARHLHDLGAREYSKHTIEKERCQLLAIWRFACDRRLIYYRPTIQKIQAPEPVPLAWSKCELELLFAACKATQGRIGDHRASDWWYALHCVLWDSGERIGAVMKARWGQIDNDGVIVFPAEHRKGSNRANKRQLHDETIAALNKIRGTSDSLVFPWPLSDSYIYKRYEKILQRAGLPYCQKSKFHRMRRSVGTHVKVAGGDAQSALTHREASTTEKYLDTSIAEKEQPVDRLFRIADPGASMEALALANRFIKRNREWMNEDEVAFVELLETGSADAATMLQASRQEIVRRLNSGMLEPGPTDTKKRRMVSTVSAMSQVVMKRRSGADILDDVTDVDEETFFASTSEVKTPVRMTQGEWAGRLKSAVEKKAVGYQFEVTDLLEYGKSWFDMTRWVEVYKAASKAAGIPVSTLINWRAIATGFPPESRRHCMTWTMYALIRYQPDDERAQWMDRIEKEGIGTIGLRKMLETEIA